MPQVEVPSSKVRAAAVATPGTETHALPARTLGNASPVAGPDTLVAAVEAYRWLVRHGPVDLASEPDVLSADDAAALVTFGLADDTGDRLVPVPPATAMERVLGARQERMVARLDALRYAYRDLMRLHEVTSRDRRRRGGAVWRVLAGTETTTLATDLLRRAQREVCDVWTAAAMATVDGATAPPGVSHRVLCDQATVLAVGEERARTLVGSVEVRVTSGVTACLRIVDRRHVLVWPLRGTGGADAAYFDSPAIAAAVRWLYDALWVGASSGVGRGRPRELTDAQWRVLRLMATGMDDTALAAATGTTVRTVRAHIAAILATLDVPTRFAAGVEAARRGWL